MGKQNFVKGLLSGVLPSSSDGVIQINDDKIDFWDYLDLITNILQAMKALKIGDWDTLMKEIIEIKEGVEDILNNRDAQE